MDKGKNTMSKEKKQLISWKSAFKPVEASSSMKKLAAPTSYQPLFLEMGAQYLGFNSFLASTLNLE